MEDSSLRQWWRFANVLFKIRNGALTPRDVRNEDRPVYVHENKGKSDKMSSEIHGFLDENAPLAQ
jgi:hypothetical protein